MKRGELSQRTSMEVKIYGKNRFTPGSARHDSRLIILLRAFPRCGARPVRVHHKANRVSGERIYFTGTSAYDRKLRTLALTEQQAKDRVADYLRMRRGESGPIVIDDNTEGETRGLRQVSSYQKVNPPGRRNCRPGLVQIDSCLKANGNRNKRESKHDFWVATLRPQNSPIDNLWEPVELSKRTSIEDTIYDKSRFAPRDPRYADSPHARPRPNARLGHRPAN